MLPLIAGLMVDDAAAVFNPAFYVPLACARSRTREGDVTAPASPH